MLIEKSNFISEESVLRNTIILVSQKQLNLKKNLAN